MKPLGGGWLTRMQDQAASFALTERCTIERSSQTSNDLMEMVENWSVVALGVHCRLIISKPPSGMIQETGERPAIGDEYKLALPRNTDIQADDRVTVNDVEYDVTRIDDSLTDKFFIHAILARRRGVEL